MKRSLICILLIICKVFRVDLNESLKQCNNTTTISYVLSMHMLLVREVASGATIRCCLIFFAFLLCLDFAFICTDFHTLKAILSRKINYLVVLDFYPFPLTFLPTLLLLLWYCHFLWEGRGEIWFLVTYVRMLQIWTPIQINTLPLYCFARDVLKLALHSVTILLSTATRGCFTLLNSDFERLN